jgi:uncharacterized protein YqeY
MSLKETIIADLTAAMKAQEAGKVSTLRMVKANLMNRQIEKGGELADEEVQKALQSLVNSVVIRSSSTKRPDART